MPPRLQHGHEVPGRALEAIIPGFSANGPGTQSSSSQSESDRRARSTDETPAPRRQRLITRPPNKVPDQRSQLIYDKTDQLRKRPIPRSAGAVRDPQTAAFSTDLFEPRQERLKQFREPEIDRGESSTPSAETMETSRVPSSLNRLSLPLSRGQIRTRQEAKEQEAVIHERLKRANEPIPPYEFQNFIGKGSYGRVYVAKDLRPTGRGRVAVKVLDIDTVDFKAHLRERDQSTADFFKELRTLQQLQSYGAQNVNQIFEVLEVHSQFWIISEYCPGGSVHTLMQATKNKVEEKYLIPIARELAIGLNAVHKACIIHRDVKAANVMIHEQGALQIIDFGVAGMLQNETDKRKTMIGTPHWMGPELWNPVKEGYGIKVDTWAFGCTLFEMATGGPPKRQLEPNQLATEFRLRGPPRLRVEQGYPQGLCHLVEFCLKKDPQERPSMEEILEHPYLKDTELTHPTSLLRDFVSEFEEWAKSGGQRYSLFNDYGAAAAKLTDDLISKPEWRFSTLESTELMEDLPAAIDQQLSSGYISNDHHLPSHLDQVADMTSTKAQEDAFNSYNASEPTSPYLSDSDLTPSGSPKAHENVTHQHETTPVSDADEKKIERGEKQLGRLFDPHHSLYNYSGLNSHQSDLPLRNLTTDSSIADNKGKEVEANVTGTTNSGNIVLIDPTTLKPKRKDRDDRADQEKIDQEIEKEKINREKIMAWEFPTGEAEDIPKDSQPHKERPNTMAWQFPEGGSGNGNGNDIHEEPQTALSSAASDHSSDTFGLAYESDHSAHSDDVDEDPHTASYNPSSSDIDGTSTSRHTLDLDAYGASPDMDAEAGDAKKSRQTLDLDALMGDMGLGSATPAAYSAQESDGGIGSSRDRDAPTANTAANLVGAPPPEDVPATYFDANGNRTSRMPPEAQPPSAESMRHDASEEVDVAELTRLLTDTVEMCDYHIQYYEQLIANMSSDEEDGGDKEDDEE